MGGVVRSEVSRPAHTRQHRGIISFRPISYHPIPKNFRPSPALFWYVVVNGLTVIVKQTEFETCHLVTTRVLGNGWIRIVEIFSEYNRQLDVVNDQLYM